MTNKKLGWRFEKDSRSLNYLIKDALPPLAYKKPKTAIWKDKAILNQGSVGSCVGNGWAGFLMTEPKQTKVLTEDDALRIYHRAQDLDAWPGTNYEGTSVLAGVKATMELFPGVIDHYRWALDIDDMIATLGYFGPVVVGVKWYTEMDSPDKDGFVSVTGSNRGGHCFEVNGYDAEGDFLHCIQSWGLGFAQKGHFKIHKRGFKTLIAEGAEMAIAVKK